MENDQNAKDASKRESNRGSKHGDLRIQPKTVCRRRAALLHQPLRDEDRVGHPST